MKCDHNKVGCINPYELIRKYHCYKCGEVMMCQCEEDFARKFLPHQLNSARDLKTHARIMVTLGFQKNVCNACKGLPEEATPKAARYGRTSKVVRYYWREIFFETTRRFGNWIEKQGETDLISARRHYQEKYKAIEKKVVEDIKRRHQLSPKYIFKEESQSAILSKYNVEIINLEGCYIKQDSGKVKLLQDGKSYSVEDFATEYFEARGYKVLFTESVPFHVLFGIFMWLLIQNHNDSKVRLSGFGNRAFEQGNQGGVVWTLLPDDFGTSGYAMRRAKQIKRHLATLPSDKDELLWLFDYWIEPSADLRQYLWAHRPNTIATARRIVEILPVDIIIKVLHYLVNDYWSRYCGWPDLLIYKNNEFSFIEVKSSGDKLSEEQKNWIRGNAQELHMPFKFIKIHKSLVRKK